MKTLVFYKGLLVLEIPDRYTRNVKSVEAKSYKHHWCIRIVSDAGTLIGEGTAEQCGPEFIAHGGEVKELPHWWDQGKKLEPVRASISKLFGRSSRVIEIGNDNG